MLVPFCLGYYVSYLIRSVNAVIAPDLVRELRLDAGDLGLLTSTYFLAFAVAQLPIGLALDRYGPRRVVGTLLVVAAVGMLLFARSDHFLGLAAARGLAGLGVSACLMGAFKAFSLWFPAQRMPSLTGLVMAAGAAGALSASLPLEWLRPLVGWRSAILLLAALTAASALLLGLVAPGGDSRRAAGAGHDETPTEQLDAMWAVLRSRPFWRLAPQAALFTGGFMALQGLWIVPWLIHVEGRTRAAAAGVLMVLNLGMLVGQLMVTVGASTLERAGIGRERMMTGGLTLALLVEAMIVTRVIPGPTPWFALGVFAAAGPQVYGVATSQFPGHLSGRVTGAINQMAFLGAFVLQWGLGLVIDTLSAYVDLVTAYEMAFSAMWVAQAGAVAWTGWARGTSS